jgi:hypothetical protein
VVGGREKKTRSKKEKERKSLFHRRCDLLLRLRRKLGESQPGPRAVLHVLFAALCDALLKKFFWAVYCFSVSVRSPYENGSQKKKKKKKWKERKKKEHPHLLLRGLHVLPPERVNAVLEAALDERVVHAQAGCVMVFGFV